MGGPANEGPSFDDRCKMMGVLAIFARIARVAAGRRFHRTSTVASGSGVSDRGERAGWHEAVAVDRRR